MQKIPENIELLSEITYTETEKGSKKKKGFLHRHTEEIPRQERQVKEALFRTADGEYVLRKETVISEKEARIWMENYNQMEAWIKCFGLPLNMK